MVELNGLDIVFLLIIVFAAIRAGFRGFVKELLSTAALFGGIAVAVLFSGIAAVYVQPWVGDGPLAQVVAFLGLFLLELVHQVRCAPLEFVRLHVARHVHTQFQRGEVPVVA